jgi:effector-binding domain-containing protein
MNNDVKIGCILQSYGDAPKYKIYLTDSIISLINEKQIGRANTYQEACAVIREEVPEAKSNPYWRIFMCKHATIIDYGSYSRFAVIVPPVPSEVITPGEES